MSAIRLATTHANYQLLEQFRTPVSIALGVLGPAMMYLFFVLPQARSAGTAEAAALGLVAMCVFGVLTNSLFGLALEISSSRETAWGDFLNGLPGSASIRIGGYVLSTGALATISIIPVIVLGFLLTNIEIELYRWPLLLLSLWITTIPFMLLSAGIGYVCSLRSSVAVVQVVMIVFAVVGGLFFPVSIFPSWLQALSTLTPSRSGLEFATAAVTSAPVSGTAVVTWAVWTAGAAALAIFLARRDRARK